MSARGLGNMKPLAAVALCALVYVVSGSSRADTLVVSPFAAVRIRHCQSSVTTDTQLPVRSTGAL